MRQPATDLLKPLLPLLMRAGGEKSAEGPFFETTVFQRVQLFSNKKRFQKVSRQSQTRAIHYYPKTCPKHSFQLVLVFENGPIKD